MSRRPKLASRRLTLDGAHLEIKRDGDQYALVFTHIGTRDRVAIIKCHACALGGWSIDIGRAMESAVRQAESYRDAVCRGFESGRRRARE